MRLVKSGCYLAVALLFAGAARAEDAGPRVALHTSMGDIVLALDAGHAPVTVANFLRYVREGHYNGMAVYRVVPGFVIQSGSYDADGHYHQAHDPISLEADNGLMNIRGAVAMARNDAPNSADAEFFIDLKDSPELDHKPDDQGNATGYAVFAHVASGMEVVDAIAATPLGGNGPFAGAAPLTPVIITKAEVLN
jgi:peptidyl-prolyl cis-trans isomerase A (cyclophilin A)